MPIKFVSLILITILWPQILTERDLSLFIIWNTGQGQWATMIHPTFCAHFDMGGEKRPKTKSLIKYCANKKNYLYISHWDFDHVSMIKYGTNVLKHLCLVSAPKTTQIYKKYGLIDCNTKNIHSDIAAIYQPYSSGEATRNLLSHVWRVKNILLPGDSTSVAEKIWASKIPDKYINFLLLGHHGSKTSTSEDLLAHLPELRLAIASARFKKYKHPHWKTLAKLKQIGVATLRTEQFGNIIIEL